MLLPTNACAACSVGKRSAQWTTTKAIVTSETVNALDVLRRLNRPIKRQRQRQAADRVHPDDHEVDYMAGVQRVAGDQTYLKIVWKLTAAELPTNGDWIRPSVTWEPKSDGEGRCFLVVPFLFPIASAV